MIAQPAPPGAAAPAIECALVLLALDRTLRLEAVSGSGATARVIAVERDASGKVLAHEDGMVGEISIGASNGWPLVRVGRTSFSLTQKGAERVQSWLQQLQAAP